MKRTLTALLFIVALAGCGGESDKDKAAEGSGRGTVTCTGSAMGGDAGLPANFPVLDEMTVVAAKDSGPTHIVDGYATDGIDGVYHEMKDRLKEEQYKVLFDELEEDDSEISYETPDGSKEGQIALRSCDDDKTSFHITARAAG